MGSHDPDATDAGVLAARQAALLDQARDAILVVDLDDLVVTYANCGVERVYGWRVDQVVGRRIDDLLGVEDRDLIDDARHALRTHGSWGAEMRHVAADGRELVVSMRLSAFSEDTTHQSALIISTDVTERRRLEQQMVRAQRVESLGALASGIAHDLNNLLSPMVLAVDLLASDEKDPDRLELLRTIRAGASRGAQMVRRILSFARGAEDDSADIEVRALVEETATLLRDGAPDDVEVLVEVAPDLPALTGDPIRLRQVLLNLAINARDALTTDGTADGTAGGTITLRALFEQVNLDADTAIAGLDVGPHVVLEVSDTGVGMDEATRAQIFDPFFTTKASGVGTGLGLPTTRTIVERHGGTLDVASEPGRGTVVRVHLPVR